MHLLRTTSTLPLLLALPIACDLQAAHCYQHWAASQLNMQCISSFPAEQCAACRQQPAARLRDLLQWIFMALICPRAHKSASLLMMCCTSTRRWMCSSTTQAWAQNLVLALSKVICPCEIFLVHECAFTLMPARDRQEPKHCHMSLVCCITGLPLVKPNEQSKCYPKHVH